MTVFSITVILSRLEKKDLYSIWIQESSKTLARGHIVQIFHNVKELHELDLTKIIINKLVRSTSPWVYFLVVILSLLFLSYLPGLSSPPHIRSGLAHCYLWSIQNGSYSGHGLLPPLVDGGYSSHWEPAFLCCASWLVVPAHHAQVGGLLLLPVQRTRWVYFTVIGLSCVVLVRGLFTWSPWANEYLLRALLTCFNKNTSNSFIFHPFFLSAWRSPELVKNWKPQDIDLNTQVYLLFLCCGIMQNT